MKVVEARGLRKRFGDHKVLEDISFEVVEGECFGILGPIGSGKSTLIRALYGACQLDAGELYINNYNLKQNLKSAKYTMGIVAAQNNLDSDFTVRQNLKIFGRYQGLHTDRINQRTEKLMKTMGLEPWSDQNVELLPEGLKRRLALARALVHEPNLIILDEPSQGMNAKSRQWLWSYLNELKADKKSVLLTTYYMEEAQAICDRIAIMDYGKILAIGEPFILIDQLIGQQVVELQVSKSEIQYYSTRLVAGNYRFQAINDKINVHLDKNQNSQDVIQLVQSSKVTIRSPHLGDVFQKLSGHFLREDAL